MERVQEAEDELEGALRDLHTTKGELDNTQKVKLLIVMLLISYQNAVQHETMLYLQEELQNCQEELDHTHSEKEQLTNRLSLVEAQLRQVTIANSFWSHDIVTIATRRCPGAVETEGSLT